LRAPRQAGHSGNFTDLFSSVREEQRGYIDGLLVVSIILSVLFLIWAFILVVLKCKGKEVGCASGQAFVSLRPDDENSEADVGKTQNDTASTSDSSKAESTSGSSNKPLFSEYGGTVIENSSSDFSDDSNHSDRKRWRCLRRKDNKKEGNIDDTRTNRRERRTRLTFIVFASIALICAIFTLFLTFGPLKEAVMEVATTQSQDSLILVRTEHRQLCVKWRKVVAALLLFTMEDLTTKLFVFLSLLFYFKR